MRFCLLLESFCVMKVIWTVCGLTGIIKIRWSEGKQVWESKIDTDTLYYLQLGSWWLCWYDRFTVEISKAANTIKSKYSDGFLDLTWRNPKFTFIDCFLNRFSAYFIWICFNHRQIILLLNYGIKMYTTKAVWQKIKY